MTTYTDWQTRDGLIAHEVQQFVTPNVVVSYFYIPRLNEMFHPKMWSKTEENLYQ